MPAPYTPETIAAIRAQARRNISARGIANLLGWDLARLQSVARKHDIHLVAGSGTPISTFESLVNAIQQRPRYSKPIADGKLKPLRALERDHLSWDVETRMVSFRDLSVKLTKAQMNVLRILASTAYPVDPETLALRAEYGGGNHCKVHITRLRAKLATIGLSISPGHGQGYQLVVKA
jgi:DNA-binding response OmpR family regulator